MGSGFMGAIGNVKWTGTPLAPPKPVFRKLDPSVVDEELARLDALEASVGRVGVADARR